MNCDGQKHKPPGDRTLSCCHSAAVVTDVSEHQYFETMAADFYHLFVQIKKIKLHWRSCRFLVKWQKMLTKAFYIYHTWLETEKSRNLQDICCFWKDVSQNPFFKMLFLWNSFFVLYCFSRTFIFPLTSLLDCIFCFVFFVFFHSVCLHFSPQGCSKNESLMKNVWAKTSFWRRNAASKTNCENRHAEITFLRFMVVLEAPPWCTLGFSDKISKVNLWFLLLNMLQYTVIP